MTTKAPPNGTVLVRIGDRIACPAGKPHKDLVQSVHDEGLGFGTATVQCRDGGYLVFGYVREDLA